MASMVLGIAGKAIGAGIGGPLGGKIGGFIGATLGSMIDNKLNPTKQQGPRLDDLKLGVSAYGNSIPLLYGPENRIAGNPIWSTGLIETEKKSTSGGKGGPSVQTTEWSYRASTAVLIAGRECSRLMKIWANGKLIYDLEGGVTDWALYSSITFYPGNGTQTPDPTIEAYMGVGEAPAYIFTCYVVIADLQLADFGNAWPQMEFLIEADEEINAGAIVQDVVERCGIDPMTISTIGAKGNVRGYAVGNSSSGVGALQPLALVFDFDLAEANGTLMCISRDASPLGVVPYDDLAGYQVGQERPEAMRWSHARTTTLPQSATVKFYDPDMDFQTNAQLSIRTGGSAQNNLTAEVPMTFDADTGKKVADRLLWEAIVARTTADATVDDRWINMMPGRRYYFETPIGGLEVYRLTRKTRGANGVIDIEAVRDNTEVYSTPNAGQGGNILPNPVVVPGTVHLVMLDTPLLLDADSAKPYGFYYGGYVEEGGFRGFDFKRALTPGGEYQQIEPQGVQAVVGDCDNTLDINSPMSGEWDDIGILTVTMRREDMVLESASDGALEAGANAAYVGPQDGHGGEIIQFGNAFLVAPGVYELSHLLRGRRGTEAAEGDHGTGEMFVLLDTAGIHRVDFGPEDIGQTRYYKAVGLLTLEADAIETPFMNTGAGEAPFTE